MPNEKTETTLKERQRKTEKGDARPRETRLGTRVDIQHQEKAQKGLKEERKGRDVAWRDSVCSVTTRYDTTRHDTTCSFYVHKLTFYFGGGGGGTHMTCITINYPNNIMVALYEYESGVTCR